MTAPTWGPAPLAPLASHAGLAENCMYGFSTSYTCRFCGAIMKERRRVQCGSLQCKRAFNAERMREYAAKKKRASGRSIYADRKDRTRTIRHCERCGDQLWPGASIETRTHCRPCSRRIEKHARLQQVVLNAAAGSSGASVWTAGPCPRCGRVGVSTNSNQRHCSQECIRAAKDDRRHDIRARRRARKRGAFVERVFRADIYERDGWRCRLCRKPVRRNEKVPHPLAPVLDHIIPLAVGGSHEPSNVQLAHFLCNSHKRDLPSGDQLRLPCP